VSHRVPLCDDGGDVGGKACREERGRVNPRLFVG
jgi:hypothetical protein